MLHSNVGQTNFIGQARSFTKTFPIGNLEGFMVGKVLPLQEAFQCDVLARIPVGVQFNSAFLAPEQGIVPAFMSLANSTAVVAELGSMPAVHNVKRDSLVKTAGSEGFPELSKGHPHNDLIEPFAFGFESFEVLYGNVGIEPQCHVGYTLYHLADIGLHKISFLSPQSPQSRNVIGTLHLGTSFHYPLALDPDVRPKVSLVENLAFIGKNGNRNSLRIEVNAKGIPLFQENSILLGEICNNIEIGSQPIGLACPSVPEKVGISLEVAAFGNRDRNPISWIDPELDKEHGLCLEGFAVARAVEFDSIPEGLVLASPNRTFNIADNLDIERGAFLGG
jgi:hypothetical protein